MNNVQDTYLKLLCYSLWGNGGERYKAYGVQEVMDTIQLAAFQGTGPLVYDQLLKLEDVEISADLRLNMKQQCVSNMMLQQLMCGIFSRAWNALEEADIHPVLLKGFGLAQYYPQPHLRQWGDIDLFVGKNYYHKACEVLRNALPESKHPKEEFDFLKHYNFVFDNSILEMHRVSMTFAHPRDRRYYEGLEEMYLTKDGPKCEIEGLLVTTPEETFNVFFVFLHAWHHFVETGMNMKQLCDIAILLHALKDYIDKGRLHEMLTKLHLMEAWQLIMYILVNRLGLAKEECPFYTEKCMTRAELLFEQVLIEGSLYKKDDINAEGVSYLKRKWLTFMSRLADSRRVHPFAPSYARHMIFGDIIHGIERTIIGSERAVNVECV